MATSFHVLVVIATSALVSCGGDERRVLDGDTSTTGSGGEAASSGSGGDDTISGSTSNSSTTGAGGAGAEGGSGSGGIPGSGGAGGTQVSCTKHVKLHMANFSYVAPLVEAAGAVNNGCWTYEARGAGFRCNYAGGEGDYVKTSGDGDWASYNEIKPLNAHDAAAVQNCKKQSGQVPVRTYVVWNGSSWDNEGIAASVHYAELYGTQADRDSKLSIWSGKSASFKSTYRPMINLSPETASSGEETYASVKKICKASAEGQWLGIYFYDPEASGGAGMADWKRMKIIEAMNDCTTE